MNKEIYQFEEPHFTGGCALVTITREQIIKYMKKTMTPCGLSDSELIKEFCVVHWAWKTELTTTTED